MKLRFYFSVIFFLFISSQAISQTTIFPYASAWKYLDNGSNQGTAWRAVSFSDASWKSGNGQLGYGDGDEATTVSYGTSSSNKYITTYFRRTFTIANRDAYISYTINVRRDDGIVIYINGTEVYRNNIPAGTISYNTLASSATSDDGNTPHSFSLSPSAFISGNNTIAVEIHQSAVTSSDISFDMELKGNTGGTSATLTRGPYLNLATLSGIIIRWKTNIPTNSKVNYGTTAGNLTSSVTNNTLTTDHIVQLSGLAINTKYFYSIGSTTQLLQGDGNNYFNTRPQISSVQKIRILAMGDMGNNSTTQVNVRNAYLNYIGTNHTDIWMLLGDNAYNNGTETEYQNNFFNIYQGSLTKNHVLWPAPGNHDYAGSSARQADHLIPYYDIFSLPKNAEAGGIASNTEAYYSYNYANTHFVSLDSYGWETGNTRLYDTTGPQVTWLKQDLAANKKKWTIVYFHHPPYTKGSHNSDTETELINMRQRLVRILERYKVDLVLNGHSHSYERSYLINGHYGVESTYNPSTHTLNTSSAKYNGSANSCPYLKKSSEIRNGIVFAVVGSSGQLGGTTSGYPHNSMYYSNVTNGGSMVIEIENNRLDAKWVCSDGAIRDNFTILKDVNKTNNVTVVAGSSTKLTASWIGSYLWSSGQTTRSITVSPSANRTYTVTDNLNCLTDRFNVSVSPQSVMATVSQKVQNQEIKVYPSLLKSGGLLNINKNTVETTKGVIYDAAGRLLKHFTFTGATQISTSGLKPGIYLISFISRDKRQYAKFVVAE